MGKEEELKRSKLAWAALIAIQKDLIKIKKDVMDFEVEDAIETIIESCDNYGKEAECD